MGGKIEVQSGANIKPSTKQSNRTAGKTDVFDLVAETPEPGDSRKTSRLQSTAPPLQVRMATPPVPAPLRKLELSQEPESWGKRFFWLLIAFGISAVFFWFTHAYWTPAHPGVDQNGYLVGGKMMVLHHGTTAYAPTEPYQYVGPMWVGYDLGQPNARYYPKYPAGLPFIKAILLSTDWNQGKVWAFYVAPVAMTLSVLGMFFLTRLVAGSYFGICGMLLLATNQIVLNLTNDANSHGPCLFFVVWGMYFLISGWTRASLWRWLLAGSMLGYAVTIRYTEGLLVLPIAFAALFSLTLRRPGSWVRSAALLFSWAIPVGGLVAFNWLTMHSITGYDTTNESTGFTVAEFLNKWEYTISQLNNYGLLFVLPLGLVGMILMYRWSGKLALMLTLWFVPGALLYTAYYWGQRFGGWPFLRFFVTLFPPVIMSAMWLIRRAVEGIAAEQPDRAARGSLASPLAGGLLTAAAGALGIYIAVPQMERSHDAAMNVAYTSQRVVETVPTTAKGQPVIPVLFGSERGMGLLYTNLQFVGDFELYSMDAFIPKNVNADVDVDSPTPLQPARRKFLVELYQGKTDQQLTHEANRIMNHAIDAQRPVFAILLEQDIERFRRRFITSGFRMTSVAHWREPVEIPTEDKPTAMNPRAGGTIMPMRQAQSWNLCEITRAEPSQSQSITLLPQ